MDWNVALPLFRRLLSDDAYLAIIERRTIPDPWSILGPVVERYRTDAGYQPYNMVSELEHHGLFRKTGEAQTTPVPFEQPIDDFIESYHSRSGFSRERMSGAMASAFDHEARKILESAYPDGKVRLQVVGSVVWGVPMDR
jgi:hypothetical protein